MKVVKTIKSKCGGKSNGCSVVIILPYSRTKKAA